MIEESENILINQVMAIIAAAGISDDFDRADNDSLGANWTEVVGDIDIASNKAQFMNGSFAKNFAVYSGASCSTVNQYAKFTITFAAQSYIGVLFRYTDSSSPFMGLQLGSTEGLAFWTYYPNAASSSTDVTNGTITVNSGDTYGVTITGTGNGTIVRVWRNITANAPTSASLWDGAAPTLEFTTNPPNPVDTGLTVGIEGYSSAGANIQLDNFFAGDIP